MMIKLTLELFICVIYTELFEAVMIKNLKAKDIQNTNELAALRIIVSDFQVDFFNDPGEEIFENEFGNGVTGGIGFRRVEADFDFFPHHVLYLSQQQLLRLILDPSILLKILDELLTALF